jgi:hypothetical protein
MNFPTFNPECNPERVPVVGHAQAFVGDAPIADGQIRVLETNERLKTNRSGNFALCARPGSHLTFMLSKHRHNPLEDFITTQTAIIPIGDRPLIDKDNEVTLQVPRVATFELLARLLVLQHHLMIDPSRCQVATTVAGFGKTLVDDPQGEPGATVVLMQNGRIIPHPQIIYFGIILGKTNPFATFAKTTSRDGGVILYNLLPSHTPYTLTAEKPGRQFSAIDFLCRPGSFVNLSPPYSPTVINGP